MLDALGVPAQNVKAYRKMVKGGCVYKCCIKENRRSCDYFAQLRDGTFIKINIFVVDVLAKEEWTCCHVVNTQACEYSQELRKVTSIGGERKWIKTTEIRRISVFLDIEDEQLLCPVPNERHY